MRAAQLGPTPPPSKPPSFWGSAKSRRPGPCVADFCPRSPATPHTSQGPQDCIWGRALPCGLRRCWGAGPRGTPPSCSGAQEARLPPQQDPEGRGVGLGGAEPGALPHFLPPLYKHGQEEQPPLSVDARGDQRKSRARPWEPGPPPTGYGTSGLLCLSVLECRSQASGPRWREGRR